MTDRVQVDLNSDLGEGFGSWTLGEDDARLELVTSADVACGFYAGDPSTMRRTCARAAGAGVAIGAQVGYRDLVGFGRRFIDTEPEALTQDVVYQPGALEAFARIAGDRVRYVKPHGALYNAIVHHEEQAAAVVAAVVDHDPGLSVVGLPGSACCGWPGRRGSAWCTRPLPTGPTRARAPWSRGTCPAPCCTTPTRSLGAASRWPPAGRASTSTAAPWTCGPTRSACTATPRGRRHRPRRAGRPDRCRRRPERLHHHPRPHHPRDLMRLLLSGSTALLVELDDLDEVLALSRALADAPPGGVTDVVPAARTVLLVTDPERTSLRAVAAAVRDTRPDRGQQGAGELVEVPVTYDGADLADAARLLGCEVPELVRRHGEQEWTVAFCGFAPGFGYLTSRSGRWDVPRWATPRTRVPAGSVALAGEFSGVYPRESPGGWQLIGRTQLDVFDLSREPAALLRPGVRVRFVPQGGA